jgi:hypothetical protein
MVNAPNPFAQIVIANLTSDQNLLFSGARRNTVQFASDKSPNEGDGHVDLIITRTGDTSAPATVNYSTADGTASQKSDYTAMAGTLRFAANETSKALTVLLTDDGLAEGTESFTVTLDGPVGAQIGGARTATINIQDNDSTSGGPNPADDSSFFVRQHYHDFLNRQPDSSGLQFWTNNIESCGADQQCREVRRINTSAAFFLSIEFQQTGYLVYRMHKAAFGNLAGKPVPVTRSAFLADTQAVGSSPAQVVVGQTGWQQQLLTNEQSFALAFVQRPQFATAYPTTLSPSQFVAALYSHTGVTPSAADSGAAVNEFGPASDTSDASARARALLDVAQNAAFSQAEFNRAFVLMQYFGYLQRDPDSAPDSDFGGYDFWLSKLDQFNGNYVQAEMVKAFITSTEYRQRFGQP